MTTILLAQINTCVGDLEGNRLKVLDSIKIAREKGAGIIIFPELTLTGYPPKDLLLRQRFIEQNINTLHGIIPETKGIAVVLGFVNKKDGKLYNAAGILHDGKLLGIQHKIHLPNYDVFDEKRYFSVGTESHIWNIDGLQIGVNICEDIWASPGPMEKQSGLGARLIVNISASPFHLGKTGERRELISEKAKALKVDVCYCNLVGGQDDLIFDGQSYVINSSGQMVQAGAHFAEDRLWVTGFES